MGLIGVRPSRKPHTISDAWCYQGAKTPLDMDGIDDRAYRIVKNESITKLNMYTGAGVS